jgi:hypothetical protein
LTRKLVLIIAIAVAVGAGAFVLVRSQAPRGASTNTAERSDPADDAPLLADVDPGSLLIGPQRLDFGKLSVGDRKRATLLLTNAGQEPVVIDRVHVEKPFATSVTQVSLAPGEERDVAVTFVPREAGDYGSYRLLFESEAFPQGRVAVPIAAVAYGPAAIRVTPLSLSFGEVAFGSESTALVTVRNTGNYDLRISSVRAPKPFSVEVGKLVVEPGQTRNVRVLFSPEDPGHQRANLMLESNDPERRRVLVNLDGIGRQRPPQADIQLSASTLDFGRVPIGDSAERWLTVRNDGTDPLSITSVTLFDPFQGPSRSRTLPPGASYRFPVRFAPRQAGPHFAPLMIHSNAPGASPISVALAGAGRSDGATPETAAQGGEVLSVATNEGTSRGPGDGAAGGDPDPAPLGFGGGDPALDTACPGGSCGEVDYVDEGDPALAAAPGLQEGSKVHIGTSGGELSPIHVEGFEFDPAAGTLTVRGLRLPTVEMALGEYFEFSPVDQAVGTVTPAGDVTMTVPITMRDTAGNPTTMKVVFTTGTATALLHGTQLAVTGNPIGPDGTFSLVMTEVGEQGSALDQIPMEIVLNGVAEIE